MTDYEKIEQVKQIITELLQKIGTGGNVEFEESVTKGLVFNISSPDSYMLIGRQGSTLHSLQVLAHALVSKKVKSAQPFYFTLDVDDYKMKREWFLRETAKQAVEQIKKTGRSQALEPMPSYERRYVHAYIQEHYPEFSSESVGMEPRRKVVVKFSK